MKRIILLLICLLLIGCKQEAIVEEEVVEKPIVLGVFVADKSVHNYIIGTEPEGVFIVLDIEITNNGQEDVIIIPDDITLKDVKGTSYPVDLTTYVGTKKEFPFKVIRISDTVGGKLVFDVPDPNEEFSLTIKNKKVIV